MGANEFKKKIKDLNLKGTQPEIIEYGSPWTPSESNQSTFYRIATHPTSKLHEGLDLERAVINHPGTYLFASLKELL